jgi:hypothetical protein
LLRASTRIRLAAAATTVVLAAGLTASMTGAAEARATVSSHNLLDQLGSRAEHPAGYARSKFTLWTDADHDGCDTRDEVLITEGAKRPSVGAGCALTHGRWVSRYDGVSVTNPSGFDIDHLVPLHEAWQSGAWSWDAQTRKAYANDLGYSASLIAVSAHANRSKGDREPQDWMPERAGYSCDYISHWVAVKWRWHLTVNSAERSFLRRSLKTCGWPRVARPARPAIGTAAGSGAGAPTPTSTPTPTTAPGNVVGYTVHPGAFCSEHGSYGYTAAGTLMRCVTTSTDARYRWRSA